MLSCRAQRLASRHICAAAATEAARAQVVERVSAETAAAFDLHDCLFDEHLHDSVFSHEFSACQCSFVELQHASTFSHDQPAPATSGLSHVFVPSSTPLCTLTIDIAPLMPDGPPVENAPSTDALPPELQYDTAFATRISHRPRLLPNVTIVHS